MMNFSVLCKILKPQAFILITSLWTVRTPCLTLALRLISNNPAIGGLSQTNIKFKTSRAWNTSMGFDILA